MSRDLIRQVRRLQDRPWNRQGADKTWVLTAMWQHRLFVREARHAFRVAGA